MGGPMMQVLKAFQKIGRAASVDDIYPLLEGCISRLTLCHTQSNARAGGYLEAVGWKLSHRKTRQTIYRLTDHGRSKLMLAIERERMLASGYADCKTCSILAGKPVFFQVSAFSKKRNTGTGVVANCKACVDAKKTLRNSQIMPRLATGLHQLRQDVLLKQWPRLTGAE